MVLWGGRGDPWGCFWELVGLCGELFGVPGVFVGPVQTVSNFRTSLTLGGANSFLRFEAARQVRRHAVARDGCQPDQVLREEIVTKETVGRDRAAVRGTPSAHRSENQRRGRS